MLKSIQIKIILAFSIVGIIAITAFGFVSISNLQQIQAVAIQAAENSRNTESCAVAVAFDECRTCRVPGGVTACFEGAAQSA